MELLLYSQYLTENIDQVSLNTTVSGALDRSGLLLLLLLLLCKYHYEYLL